ncbi:MAG TPA: universal stress protein [Burkholderiales bacterium]|nr:universal stress protein [Burkholderiales bacterium]
MTMKKLIYRRILVAMDGSECSELALRHAVQFARTHRAKLHLLYVVDEIGLNVGQPRTPDEFWQAVRKAGKGTLDKAKAQAAESGIATQTKLIEIPTMGSLVRHVAEVIVQEAVRSRADLVVVGTHGRRGLSRLLLGSVAEGVLRHCTVPVLLVRGRATRRKPRSREA